MVSWLEVYLLVFFGALLLRRVWGLGLKELIHGLGPRVYEFKVWVWASEAFKRFLGSSGFGLGAEFISPKESFLLGFQGYWGLGRGRWCFLPISEPEGRGVQV